MISAAHGTSRFEFTGDDLLIATGVIERRWRVRDGLLYATSFLHLPTKTQWITKPSPVPSPFVSELAAGERKVDATVDVKWSDLPLTHVQREDTLVVTLTVARGAAKTDYRFQVFTDSAGVTIDVTSSAGPTTQPSAGPEVRSFIGLETPVTQPGVRDADLLEAFALNADHLKLVAARFADQTDRHDNLLFESEYMLTASETLIQCTGDVFTIENVLNGNGLVFVKQAPTPHAQSIRPAFELEVRGREISFHGHGIGSEGGSGYPFTLLAYAGGREGRMLALQRHQMDFRDYARGRDGMLLTNTWGDRSRNTHITEPFIAAEIDAAAKLGVDVLEIDDGWQQGATANTTKGGVNESYWAQPDFWIADPKRLPHGLGPIVESAKTRDMSVGLWFAPDSIDDFANWQQDLARIMEFHQKSGINYFKLDMVKIRSKLGETRFRSLLSALIEQSKGKIALDLDVTNQMRLGYFGAIAAGSVFVENRYTDSRRYWPHQTLRNLWRLSQYIKPIRLRMEFLNNARNAEKYGDDSLAPARYDPAYLFASVMLASPLGWFENSNLPAAYVDAVAPLVKVWKEHRDAIYAGETIPIGQTPDGTSWTGFLSRGNDGAVYVLIFREFNRTVSQTFTSSLFSKENYKTELLFGKAEFAFSDGQFMARMEKPLSFAFARLV